MFESDGDIMVYTFKTIVAHCGTHTDTFAALSAWWVLSLTILEERCMNYINNLRIRHDNIKGKDV